MNPHIIFRLGKITALCVMGLSLVASPSVAFDDLPISSFDSLSSFAFTMHSNQKDNYDRDGYRYYFSFSPVENFGFVFEGSRSNLHQGDRDFEMPLGRKNQLKKNFSRNSLGLRTTFFNKKQSSVKVGIHTDVIINDTKDQDGESVSVTPFIYMGNQLPLSLRYAYSTETARRAIRKNASDFGTMDNFYASHIYLRFDPYRSVARFPLGYEYYYRSGTAPDVRDFDTVKSSLTEHRVFYYLPNDAQIVLKAENHEGMQISIGLEYPFF